MNSEMMTREDVRFWHLCIGIEEAQKYILKNIHIGMKLEGLYRVDVPEISVPAMREAIINAFCHRDYRDPDYVQVAIFKDRVEIRNPGEHYGGLTIDRIRKGNVSRRRNPLIAELLRRVQMVETWGRGMRLILAEEATVQFEEVAQLFIDAFNRPSYDRPAKTIDKIIDKHLSVTDNAIIVPRPNLAEQAEITKILDTNARRVRDLQYTLEKCQALKTALMQDLLTRKKPVTALLKRESILNLT